MLHHSNPRLYVKTLDSTPLSRQGSMPPKLIQAKRVSHLHLFLLSSNMPIKLKVILPATFFSWLTPSFSWIYLVEFVLNILLDHECRDDKEMMLSSYFPFIEKFGNFTSNELRSIIALNLHRYSKPSNDIPPYDIGHFFFSDVCKCTCFNLVREIIN